MRYYIADADRYFDDYEEVIEYCIVDDYHYDDDYFEEWVNQSYGSIEIYGREYYAYDILRNCDEGELDDLLRHYCEIENENDKENAYSEFRYATPGETIIVQAYEVQVEEDEFENGDTDGDEEVANSLDEVRQFLEEQNSLREQTRKQEEESENEVLNLFQVIP